MFHVKQRYFGLFRNVRSDPKGRKFGRAGPDWGHKRPASLRLRAILRIASSNVRDMAVHGVRFSHLGGYVTPPVDRLSPVCAGRSRSSDTARVSVSRETSATSRWAAGLRPNRCPQILRVAGRVEGPWCFT